MKAASDYGALTAASDYRALTCLTFPERESRQKQNSSLCHELWCFSGFWGPSVADFQWSQTFKEPPSVWKEILHPIPVALASGTKFFKAMLFATLQHLGVGHSDTTSPIRLELTFTPIR
ncbi:putative HAUS augmin-like complex subunit 2 [Rosa chinensis]|uniref:Putative HAUS augmin-like complex subunit 2 n=1 Tax=Rosa chinensis TaxID=74649 RepID=A0A2P6S1Y2_ROSCH|nr:putative HAUS augmin-like complex subunit 2 [Rosa chinensis]